MDLHLVGGFLGSGKTTAIVHAARLLTGMGERVGIITNEQGKHLVDSGFIHAQGLHALEVTGGCICCHLDDFEDRIEEISVRFHPDVLFAESVGSCTDLVATVIKPLTDYKKVAAQPASLSVFTDSRMLLRYLRDLDMPFSDQVMYIFEKQIEETDLVILNKIDLLSSQDREDIVRLARKRYPEKMVQIQNSHEKKDIEAWLSLIKSDAVNLPQRSLELDYDAYASGESRFFWLDRVLEFKIREQNPGEILAELVQKIFEIFSDSEGSIAHIKFLIETPDDSFKINLTALDEKSEIAYLEKIWQVKGSSIQLIVNAMVEGELDLHAGLLDKIIASFCEQSKINYREIARFDRVPGFPRPTMRVANN